MNAGEELVQALERLGRELDAAHLEPDPERRDWEQHSDALSALRDAVDEVIAAAEPGLAALEGTPPEREKLRNHAVQLVAEVAAVMHAASRRDVTARLLGAAIDLAPTGPTRDEIEAARRDPSAYVLLVLGRWHQRGGDFASGDRVLSRARSGRVDPTLRTAMDRCLEGPRPLTSGAPPLFRFNGCGLALYGARDGWDDGSHVSTYCVCLLFIPVLPLTAYRVIDHSGGSYTFLASEKLSAFARGYRWLLAAAAAAAIVVGISNAYLHSPQRLASAALEEAEQAESAGRADEALAGYQRVVDEHPFADLETGGAATLGLVRILTGRVEAPMTRERADEAARIVRRYLSLPSRVRGGRAASLLVERLESWAAELRGEDPRGRRAALRLADLGREVAQGPDRERIDALAAGLHGELAREVREDWPLEALHHYVLAGTDEALSEATPIVASLDVSLFADAEEDVTRWSDAVANAPEAAARVAELRRELAEIEGDARRTQALESGDAEALSILHEERAADQAVAATLADARRASGDLDGALALLTPYGIPGRLSARAQRALAGCYADQGRLVEADALLSRQVEMHLPAFQDAQRAYAEASQERVAALIASAQQGREYGLEVRLTGVTDQARGEGIVSEWLRERLEADPELTRLRDAYLRHSALVPTVLTLGSLKLRRAHESHGEERAQLLEESERLFLSIREEAEGVPAFHMSLGQVYHRLGRTEDGERELRGVLEQGDPEASIAVAHVYRDLGLVRRAREVADAVYRETGSESPMHANAALLLSLLATRLEDEELWLGRAPQELPEVRVRLLSTRARRAVREGDLREADRLLAEVVQHYGRETETSAAAANNAAIAEHQRYSCTGDPQALERATSLQEQSLRLSPDDAIVLGNTAEATAYRGEVRILERWIRVHALRLGPLDTDQILGALREGPLSAELAAASREDPSLRRSNELTRQEQVLSPQNTRAWIRSWGWASAEHDDEGLATLLSRVQAIEGLDTSSYDERREQARDPEGQAARRAELDNAVSNRERSLEAAERTRHAPTIAAARLLLANVLLLRAHDQAIVADARRALSLAREARAGWDAIGSSQLAAALGTVVLLEMLDQAPALRAVFDEQGRELPATFLMREAVRREPSLAVALRARSELTEAAEARAVAPPRELGIEDLVLAELADHAGLRAAGASFRALPSTRRSLELRALFFPGEPLVAARRSVLDD